MFQARQRRILFSPPPSAMVTSAQSARLGLLADFARMSAELTSFTTPAHPSALLARPASPPAPPVSLSRKHNSCGDDQPSGQCAVCFFAISHSDQRGPATECGRYYGIRSKRGPGRLEDRLQGHRKGQHFRTLYPRVSEQSVDRLSFFVQLLLHDPHLQHGGDWTRMISPSLVNDFRIGWSHVTLNSGNSLGFVRRSIWKYAGYRQRKPWRLSMGCWG